MDFNTRRFLLKVDVSGIQSYIFDTPSKGASKELKARSFYVYALTHLAENYFKTFFQSRFEKIYNGGGNLFAFLNSDKETLENKINEFQSFFDNEDIYPFICYIDATDTSFQDAMGAVGKKMAIAKLRKPVSFNPYNVTKSFEWKEFTEHLAKAAGFTIHQKTGDEIDDWGDKHISKAGLVLKLQDDEKTLSEGDVSFKNNIINKLPLDNRDKIIDFDTISQKALERSADDKLAALKMDVDDLGMLFRDRELNEYKIVSERLEEFFSASIYSEILNEHIQEGNIYPVFAGGDDCFLIGAWDIISDIAIPIRDNFFEFQEKLRKEITTIKKEVTLSASIVVVTPKFPMIRLAEEAENALHLAKEAGKNCITIFGEILSWEDYREAKKMAKQLQYLIAEKDESRGLLERVKSSDIGFRSLQDRAINHHKIDFPKVYKLKYYLKNVKKENKEEILKLFSGYEKALLKDFISGSSRSLTNAARFPVAARWAELLTKNLKQNHNEQEI